MAVAGNRKRGQVNFYSFSVGALPDLDRSRTTYNSAVGDPLAWDASACPSGDSVWDLRDGRTPGISI